MSLKGLRIITNLHCNNDCKFCYQKDKSKKILDIDVLLDIVGDYSYKHFEYCTIMGGESTLLPNLVDYVKIGSLYAKETRLTTNGKLLNTKMFRELKGAGLNGVNISIASFDNYEKIHGTNTDVDDLLDMIDYMKEFDFSVRVNIPLCEENMADDCAELVRMLDYYARNRINVTMCEDIKGTYSLYEQFEKIEATEVSRTDYGLILINHKGMQMGYYTHRNNDYNETDLVVTPLGTFTGWDGYCKAVGMTV
jgi:molybdenum cofactor biosynthesis enzyme MoaA